MRIQNGKQREAEKALLKVIRLIKPTSPDDIKRIARSIFEDGIRNRDEDIVLEAAEAARSGRPHIVLSDNFRSRKPGHRPSAREVRFQFMAAVAAAALHEMGFPKGVARDAVARLAMKAGWPTPVTAAIVGDWSRGKSNPETAICEGSGSMFITVYKNHPRRDLPEIAELALFIRDALRKTLLVPATSEDDLLDF